MSTTERRMPVHTLR